MITIKEAAIARFTERNDVWCADVEVKAEGVEGTLIAEFAATKSDEFDLRHVYRKDASREIDWYDNNLHDAYQNVSKELFGQPSNKSKWGSREEFIEGILAFGSIREELTEHYRLSRTASLFHADDVEDQTYLH
ncbi:hypothetical protein [Bacillus sp. 3255]|uniref:hypothetical protein n=1 Tax=Bacillus sp. 3255 TaxID=2817904 RepID=UPI002856CE37|nr:hypothetical protein [Bacillus sp. 3255]MDR6879016.1 hypothetical protein [Bacillus sp. 3255]